MKRSIYISDPGFPAIDRCLSAAKPAFPAVNRVAHFSPYCQAMFALLNRIIPCIQMKPRKKYTIITQQHIVIREGVPIEPEKKRMRQAIKNWMTRIGNKISIAVHQIKS